MPYMLSVLAFADPDAEVLGLDAFPEEDWPPVLVCHLAFQLMVGLGMAMAGIGALALALRWRRPALLDHPRFLALLALATPIGFFAVEAGWVVTEVGRQPWIIYGVMRTEEALTPMPGVQVPLFISLGVYGTLALLVAAVLRRQIAATEAREAEFASGDARDG